MPVKKRLFFILLSCGLCGRLAATPVNVMVGSRGIGMGGAYVAIADDQSAAYWNPAGLSQVNNVSIMESNLLYQVPGLNVNYMSLAVPVENVGTVCGSWQLTSTSLEEGWNYETGGPQSTSSANEQAFVLSIGRQILKELSILQRTSVGFSINRYTYSSTLEKGAGIGLDLALHTYLPYGISFGFMGRNLGADIAGTPIDPEARFGLGYTRTFSPMHKLTAALDGALIKNRDYSDNGDPSSGASVNWLPFFGLEYVLTFQGYDIAARTGLNSALHNSFHTYGYAFGAGLKYKEQTVEYAFEGRTNSDVSIGWRHHLSLILNLSGAVKRSRIALDVTPPVMTLTGDSVLTMSTRDGFYVDSGVVAFDKVSGDLTGKVLEDSRVDPTVPGTYYITYTVFDEAGNKTTKKRTVYVSAPDTIPPVISLAGDSVMTLAVGESYNEPGVQVSDNIDSILPAPTVTGSIDLSKPGDYLLTYVVADKASNVGTKQRKITVIPELFKRYGVPLDKPINTIKSTFTKFSIDGKGPDLLAMEKFSVDWSLEDSTMRDLGLKLNLVATSKTINLKDKVQQRFNSTPPTFAIINSGVPSLDGEYYVTDRDGNLTMVRVDGSFALVFGP
jgi:hypothetical protein